MVPVFIRSTGTLIKNFPPPYCTVLGNLMSCAIGISPGVSARMTPMSHAQTRIPLRYFLFSSPARSLLYNKL
jgi:hypothetical protein